MNDPRGERFDAEPGDGCERQAAHRLRGESGRELRDRESVDSLAARWGCVDCQFVGGGSRWCDDEEFGVLRLLGEERGGALEECRVGAGVNDRARDHRQL
jgi:hypothetical protein